MIYLKNIHIAYEKVLLKNEEMKIYKNDFVVLVGESGVGKTSLLYRIALLQLDCEVFFDGVHCNELNDNMLSELRRSKIAYVLQENDTIEHFTIKETMLFFSKLVNKDISDHEIQNLLQLVSLKVALNQSVITLSLGERQRLMIACALLREPQLMILDEPTASLDEENEILIFEILKKIVKKHDMYIVIASHSKYAVQYADVIYKIENQQLHQNKEIKDDIQTPMTIEKLAIKPLRNYYLKRFFSKYKLRTGIFIVTFVFFLSICVIGSQLLDFQSHKQTQELFDSFSKQLLVVDNENLSDIANNTHYIRFNRFEDNEYPFIKISVDYANDLYVLPYYSYEDIKDMIDVDYKNSEKQGIYFSYKAKRLYETNTTLGNKVTLDYTLYTKGINNSETNTNFTLTKDIGGYIRQGVKNYYNNKSELFIYMHYEDMKEIHKLYSIDKLYIGKIYNAIDYEDLIMHKLQYEKQGYYVNDDSIDIDLMNEMTSTYDQYLFIFLGITFTVGLLFLAILKMNTIHKRKKEIALLCFNGLSKKQVGMVFVYEYILESVCTLLIVCSIDIYFLYNGLNYAYLFVGCLFVGLSTMITYLLMNYYISKINVVRVFRS